MKRILIGLTTLAALGAQASTVSYSHTTNAANAGFIDSFTLAAFDTTLGTLTGIALDVSNEMTAQINISNTTGTALRFLAAFVQANVFLKGPAGFDDGLGVAANLGNRTAPVGLSQYSGLVGGNSATFVLDLSDFAAYELTSAASSLNFAMVVDPVSTTLIQPPHFGGGLSFSGTARISGLTTITYTYDEATPSANVPEPGTLALAGVALAGLLASRRVRHAGLPA
jgi:hypothetical protein